VNVLLTLRVIVLAFAEAMRLPVRRFVPQLAVHDVHFAVLVDVADSGAFGLEAFVDDDFLPFERRSGWIGGERGQQRRGQKQQWQNDSAWSHERSSVMSRRRSMRMIMRGESTKSNGKGVETCGRTV